MRLPRQRRELRLEPGNLFGHEVVQLGVVEGGAVFFELLCELLELTVRGNERLQARALLGEPTVPTRVVGDFGVAQEAVELFGATHKRFELVDGKHTRSVFAVGRGCGGTRGRDEGGCTTQVEA